MDEGMVRNGLASLLHRSVYEIPREGYPQLEDAISKGDLNKVRSLLEGLDQAPTSIKDRQAKAEIASRMKTLNDLLDWIQKQPNGKEIVERLSPPRIVDILFAASGKDGVKGSEQFETLVSSLAYRHGATPAEQKALEKSLSDVLIQDDPTLKDCNAKLHSEKG